MDASASRMIPNFMGKGKHYKNTFLVEKAFFIFYRNLSTRARADNCGWMVPLICQ